MKNLNILAQMLSDLSLVSGLGEEKAKSIQFINDAHRTERFEPGDYVVTAEFGKLGSMVIREIGEGIELNKIEPNESDRFATFYYVSQRTILLTDHSTTEPYNRQGGLYADGSSFETLGAPVITTDTLRMYDTVRKTYIQLSTTLSGFRYNTFWDTVSFGIVVQKEMINDYLEDMARVVLGPDGVLQGE